MRAELMLKAAQSVPRFQCLCYAYCQRQSSLPSGSLKYESSPPGSDLIGLGIGRYSESTRTSLRRAEVVAALWITAHAGTYPQSSHVTPPTCFKIGKF